MKLTQYVLIALLTTALLSACGKSEEATAPEPTAPTSVETDVSADVETDPTVAIATLQARDGMAVSGTVTFTERDGEVEVVAAVRGVPDAGEHGFHIHETGDCSAPDFTSAGGHFNPAGTIHGAPTDGERHAGDFGNLEVDADGNGRLEMSSNLITLGTGGNSVLGKAVILHEKRDDLVSQPTGDAGGRIACGIIELEGMDMEVSVDVPGDPDDDGY